MTGLQDSLRALVTDPPAVIDWPGVVRKGVVQRQRRRASLAAGLAVLVVVGGLAVVAGGGPSDARVTPAVSPEPQPTADEENPVVVYLDPERTEVPAGVPVDVVVVARGFLEGPPFLQPPTVDGRSSGPITAYSCAGLPPGAKPPPLHREHREVTRTFTLTLSPGRHVVVVVAEAGCSRPGGSASRSYDVVAKP